MAATRWLRARADRPNSARCVESPTVAERFIKRSGHKKAAAADTGRAQNSIQEFQQPTAFRIASPRALCRSTVKPRAAAPGRGAIQELRTQTVPRRAFRKGCRQLRGQNRKQRMPNASFCSAVGSRPSAGMDFSGRVRPHSGRSLLRAAVTGDAPLKRPSRRAREPAELGILEQSFVRLSGTRSGLGVIGQLKLMENCVGVGLAFDGVVQPVLSQPYIGLERI